MMMQRRFHTFVALSLLPWLAAAAPASKSRALGIDPETQANIHEVYVRHYKLDLKLDPEAKTYEGTAEYTIETLTDTRRVILDAEYLQVTRVENAAGQAISAAKQESQRLFIPLEARRIKGEVFKLKAYFKLDYAQFRDHPAYKGEKSGNPETPTPGVWFFNAADGASAKPVAYTQHQTTYARRSFPCQDVTRRATFETTLRVPRGFIAHASGSPDASLEDRSGPGWSFTYRLRLPTSPYLFAFFVGDLDERTIFEGSVAQGLPKVVVLTERTPDDAVMNAALDHAAKTVDVLRALQDPDVLGRSFATPYLRLAYVPSKAKYGNVAEGEEDYADPTSGMENRGLIIFSRSLVLGLMREKLPYDYRAILVHELGHEFFGNELTCRTWEDFAVNEGSVSALHQFVLGKVFPEVSPLVQKQWQKMRKAITESAHNDGDDPRLATLHGDYDHHGRIHHGPNGRDFYYKGAWILRTAQNAFPPAYREAALGFLLRELLPPAGTQAYMGVDEWLARIQAKTARFAADNGVTLAADTASLLEQLANVPGVPELRVRCQDGAVTIENAAKLGDASFAYDLDGLDYKITYESGGKLDSTRSRVSLLPLRGGDAVSPTLGKRAVGTFRGFALDPAGEAFVRIRYAGECNPTIDAQPTDYRLATP